MHIARTAAWPFLFSTAAVVGGVYLYTVYGPRKHRQPAGLAGGLLVGQQVGGLTGFALAGPPGIVPGATVGGIVGAVLGHDVATPDGPPA